MFNDDESVHQTEGDEAEAAKPEGTVEETKAAEESKLKKDSSDLRLMGQRTIMEAKKKNEEIMSRFSSQQKELIRNIGGLPIKVLNDAS